MKSAGAMKAAEILFRCRQNTMRLDSLPPDLAPQDLDEAYAIQHAVAQRRPQPDAGFKIGLTSAAAQGAAGATAPIAGRLAYADLRRNLTKIALPRSHLRVVEAEVIFEMGRDLPATEAPFTVERVAASICAAFAGIEVCDTRYINCDELPLALIVADNSNADLLVKGDRLTEEDVKAFAALPVTLERRGQPAIRGSTAKVLGHPFHSVTWLANWLAQRGECLQRGQLIASGSCTGIAEAAADDIVAATFGTNARVSVEFALEGMVSEVNA
jgi:2-keto-4-pentenoate hydratase